jgi:holliday junction DNA helicase RuvA
MIAYITGTLVALYQPNTLIVMTADGLGYELHADYCLLNPQPQLQTQLSAHIQHIVREDAQTLFAFKSINTKDLFNQLIKVNGVGPKMGMNLLSQIEPNHLIQSILNEDQSLFKSLKGIGGKVSQRIILELKPKLSLFDFEPAQANETTNQASRLNELQQAIENLGFKSSSHHATLSKIIHENQDDDLAQLIKKALKSVSI